MVYNKKGMVRTVKSKKEYGLIATRYLAAFLLMAFCAANALAAESAAGTVTYLSGALFAKKTDGSVRTLSRDSVVEQGDTLMTEKRTYARIKFKDSSEITLRPASQFKVEAFSYNEAKPKEDKAVMELVKGGLRSLSGHVGKRGDPDGYKMKTRASVIGIRGTLYDVRICNGNCGEMEDGIYFYILEGSIIISNDGGTLTVEAGQYAFVKDIHTAPVLLPGNPGIDFKLPDNVQLTGAEWNCMIR